MSTDDWRGVEWPRQQVERIDRELANLREIFTMGRKTRETNEQNVTGRVWDLEQAMKRMEGRHRELVKQSADEIEVLSDRLNGMVPYVELAERVLRLEKGIASLSKQGNVDRDRINELQGAVASRVREELSDGFRDLEPEPEFSAPIGRAGDIEDRTHLRGTGRPARNGGIFALGSVIRHSHGQHGPHDHTTEDYAAHQRPIADEEVIHETGGVVGSIIEVDSSRMTGALFEATWSRGYEAGASAAIDEAESRVGAALDRAEIFNPSIRRRILDAIRRTDRKLLGEKGPVKNSNS